MVLGAQPAVGGQQALGDLALGDAGAHLGGEPLHRAVVGRRRGAHEVELARVLDGARAVDRVGGEPERGRGLRVHQRQEPAGSEVLVDAGGLGGVELVGDHRDGVHDAVAEGGRVGEEAVAEHDGLAVACDQQREEALVGVVAVAAQPEDRHGIANDCLVKAHVGKVVQNAFDA